MVVQVTENDASHGDMYQAWAQMGDTMTVFTPDEDLSTDLMFVTPELTEEQHLFKLCMIVSSEETYSMYLNGDKLNVIMIQHHIGVDSLRALAITCFAFVSL